MNCRKFESRLERFLAETLSPASMQECKAHLESCGSCRELFFLAAKEPVAVESSIKEDLIRSVLKKTSGGSCNQVHVLLPDYIDKELSSAQRVLVDRHLEKCTSCRRIHRTMEELSEELASLAEIDPGKDFTTECLLALQSLENRSHSQKSLLGWFRGHRWPGRIWSRLLLRPRFAWEAAYVLTLAFFLIFKTLAIIPAQSPTESIENLQGKPARAYVTVAGAIEDQYDRFRISANANRARWQNAAFNRKAELLNTLSWISDRSGSYWQSASAVAVDLPRSLWNGVVRTFEGIFQKTGPKPEGASEKEV